VQGVIVNFFDMAKSRESCALQKTIFY